ncbi:MAG: hypothetical protein NZ899_01265 [Thermoguttaceae bacterium]|nr:hypothetical protein [Thermoguttaceae bacterium]MDW8077521.1 hypothetical protein [Thermoguttaceae bacterium]
MERQLTFAAYATRLSPVVLLLAFSAFVQAQEAPASPPAQAPAAGPEKVQDMQGEKPSTPDGWAPAEVSRETSILIDVFLQMRQASQLMKQKDWQKSAAIQAQVIARLDELLRRPPPNAPPSATNAPQAMAEAMPATPQPQAAQEPQQAKTPPSGQVGNNAATSPQDQLEELRSILRGLWGELPERVRGQVSETLAEEFLPRYAPLIRDYYRRLAELSTQPRGNPQAPNRAP